MPIAAILADGWYAGYFGFDPKRPGAHYGTEPELLAQLAITYADGRQEWIVTDEHWEAGTGAVRHADLLMGERHDLRLERPGWDTPGTPGTPDTAGWYPVRCRGRDSRPLVADPGPPVRVTEEVAPRAISRYGDGRHIVDFGQNLPGWLRIRIDGPAGTTVRVRHAKVLDGDGSLYTENLRTARQTDEFITSGGPEVLEPPVHPARFPVRGDHRLPGRADRHRRHGPRGALRHPGHGAFCSSEPWLDRLFHSIDWGQRGNFISVPTDCPQRDERLGWLGDAQIFARTACYNRDVAAFFAKRKMMSFGSFEP